MSEQGDVLIENPIINSPFREPDRQFAFHETVITNQITPGRRRSSYFIPIAVATPLNLGSTTTFLIDVIHAFGGTS